MKTCKKLFSLLLVAVMLVAAIPFAAMAAPIGTAVPAGNPGITVKVAGGNAGGQFIYKAGLPENFDPALTEHLTNVLVYGNYDQYNANTVQVVSGNWDVNTSTLTINVKNVYTVKISGDATATGANKLDSVAYADYGQLTTTLTNAGLSEYLNSAKWKIVTPIVKDDTNFTLTVPVEKVVPPTTEPTTEPTTPPTTEPTTPPTTEPTTPPTTEPTTTPTPASYSKVVVVYCDENGNVNNTGKTVILTTPYTGSTANNDAQGILNHAGVGESVINYAKAEVAVSGDTITVTLTDKVDTRYVLNLTVVTGTTTTTKTYRAAYTGNVDTMSVLKGFGVDKDFNLDNYTYSTLGYDNAKTFTLTMTAKPTAADKYTVNCVVNGTQFASKTDVTYVGSFESNITNAQAILNAAGIQKTASEYKKVTITKSNTNVITVDLRNTVVVRVYNNANSYSEVTMDVGQPYVNYLGTNLINNSTFGGITVKDTSDRNTYYSASQVNGRTALVSAFDKEITIQRNGDSCTLYFLRSDGTVLESRKLYAGDQIGTLPSYIVGNVPATWTYNGKPISATDVYNFKTTSVNIVPYFGGISDVYVDVYTNGNVKTMQTRVKVTDLVQNGVLYLNSEVKSAISSALRNTSNKNLTYTAFFDASTWSDFIKTKNTNGAAEPIRVGDNSERQGSVYLYVMVNNVTQKATDSTNPKTGDDVKLGVAAAVLAVAVVGFGAAIVIKKKKGVQ